MQWIICTQTSYQRTRNNIGIKNGNSSERHFELSVQKFLLPPHRLLNEPFRIVSIADHVMKCFINKLLFISLLVICSSSAFHNAAKDSHFLSAHQPSSSSSLFKTAHMRVEDEQVISSNAIASHLNPRIKRNSGTASQNTAQQANRITLTSEVTSLLWILFFLFIPSFFEIYS